MPVPTPAVCGGPPTRTQPFPPGRPRTPRHDTRWSHVHDHGDWWQDRHSGAENPTEGARALAARLAERVITDDDEVHRLGRRIERHAGELLVLQAPVASDLRTVVCAIRIGERLERMGDLARHVAEIARLRHPRPAVPAGLADQFTEMGRLAVRACLELEDVIVAPYLSWQAQTRADDRLDQLQREVLDTVRAADPPYPVQSGVDVALLARYLERFGDQTVAITAQLDYVATGEMPNRPTR